MTNGFENIRLILNQYKSSTHENNMHSLKKIPAIFYAKLPNNFDCLINSLQGIFLQKSNVRSNSFLKEDNINQNIKDEQNERNKLDAGFLPSIRNKNINLCTNNDFINKDISNKIEGMENLKKFANEESITGKNKNPQDYHNYINQELVSLTIPGSSEKGFLSTQTNITEKSDRTDRTDKKKKKDLLEKYESTEYRSKCENDLPKYNTSEHRKFVLKSPNTNFSLKKLGEIK